jgi:hypothetical protein
MSRNFIDKVGNPWNADKDNSERTSLQYYTLTKTNPVSISICTQPNVSTALRMLPKGYDVLQARKSIDPLKRSKLIPK